MTEEIAQLHQKNEKIDICFQNLSYDVKIKKKIGFMKSIIIERNILKHIDGIAKSGEITAIMGASGAGKTSLLNIVSCRIPPKGKMHSVTGSFTVNNESYDSSIFSTFAAYVMQSDILLPTLTPKECLEFAANLRLKGDDKLKKERVEEMLGEFRLTKCQNTLVGDESIKGISGGERKRTSIAVELITDPGLILLDEPTSGLDSFTAFLIITILKNYAKQGKTVLFTIHQPNADIFDLFDKLMLLVDGKFIFQGESHLALEHFHSLGFECPIYSTAGDHFAQIMHHDFQTETYPQRCEIFYNAYEKEMAKHVKLQLQQREQSAVTKYGVATSFLYQFHHIAVRTKVNMFRNKLLIKGRFAQTIILGLLAIAIFWDLDQSSQITAIMNRVGALFFIAMNQFMMAMQPVILTFPKERALFLKEQGSNMYSVSAYYFGRTITELPFLIIFPVLFSVIIYWAMGLTGGAERFFIFVLINILSNFGGNALGLQVGSLFGDVKIATALAPALFIPFVLFSGFQKNRNDLPTWIGWFEFLSPLKYSLEGLGTNDMDGTDIQSKIDPIELMGWEIGVWYSILILFGIGMFYRITALLSLKLLVTKLQ